MQFAYTYLLATASVELLFDVGSGIVRLFFVSFIQYDNHQSPKFTEAVAKYEEENKAIK